MAGVEHCEHCNRNLPLGEAGLCDDCAGDEAPAPGHRFYLGAHLTFIVDDDGNVTGLEICPYQEHPVADDYQEREPRPSDAELSEVWNKANEKLWEFSATERLPEGITWEV